MRRSRAVRAGARPPARCRAPAGSRARGSTSPSTCCARAAPHAALVAVGEQGEPVEVSWDELRGPGRARCRRRCASSASARATASSATCRTSRPTVVAFLACAEPRRGLVGVRARHRRRERRRPLRPARADRARDRRRLPLRRQGARPARRGRPSCSTACRRVTRASWPCRCSAQRRRARGRDRASRGTTRSPTPREPEFVPGRRRAPAVGRLLLRHHRAAQGPGARPRRRAAHGPGAASGCSTTSTRATASAGTRRTSWIMWNILRLGARRRRDGGALRRQPAVADPGPAVAARRGHPADPARHQPRLPAGLREGRAAPRAASTTCRRCAPSARPARRCRASSFRWVYDAGRRRPGAARHQRRHRLRRRAAARRAVAAGHRRRDVVPRARPRTSRRGTSRAGRSSTRSASWSSARPMPSMPLRIWGDESTASGCATPTSTSTPASGGTATG